MPQTWPVGCLLAQGLAYAADAPLNSSSAGGGGCHMVKQQTPVRTNAAALNGTLPRFPLTQNWTEAQRLYLPHGQGC